MTTQSNNLSNSHPERVLFYGRTLQEYVKMFALEAPIWKSYKILDCPAGPASFVEEAKQQGIDVVGCDPLYSKEIKEVLIESGVEDIEQVVKTLSSHSHLLSQKFYSSSDLIKALATKALKIFAESYSKGREENRYIQAALPNLPFNDQIFDLVLSGNFLFVYSKLFNNNLEFFDYEFHRSSILELMRVSKKEVRIFPIPHSEGELNVYASQLLHDLKIEGIRAETILVEYEVLKGQNFMWRLTR